MSNADQAYARRIDGEPRVLRITCDSTVRAEHRLVLERLELRGIAWEWISAIVARRSGDATHVEMRGAVQHRETGRSTAVTSSIAFHDFELDTQSDVVALKLRHFLRAAVTHELDESLFFGGAQLNDPHAEGT